mgnify:FL=1
MGLGQAIGGLIGNIIILIISIYLALKAFGVIKSKDEKWTSTKMKVISSILVVGSLIFVLTDCLRLF